MGHMDSDEIPLWTFWENRLHMDTRTDVHMFPHVEVCTCSHERDCARNKRPCKHRDM